MRTLLASGLLVSLCAIPLACGGGQAAGDGAKSPESAASSAGAAGASGSGTDTGGGPGAADAGPATTTSVTLGDGGDLQGAKLSETHTVASTASSDAPPEGKGPHGHDPGRGPADIRAVVMAHRDEARACYDKALPAHPGIEGDLVIQWTIDAKGKVTQVSEDTSRSQITESSVVACVAAIIQKISFAPSPGGYETKAFYPFNFHPHHGAKASGGGQ